MQPNRAAILGVPVIATLALSAPDRALAGCGASAPAVAHPAAVGGGSVHSGGGGGGVHSGGGSGGGGGGCPNGASALHGLPLHGLPMAASGRVVEAGMRSAVHTGTDARTATTKTATRAAPTRIANASAHLGGVRLPRGCAALSCRNGAV
jgi:hypothetical protein